MTVPMAMSTTATITAMATTTVNSLVLIPQCALSP